MSRAANNDNINKTDVKYGFFVILLAWITFILCLGEPDLLDALINYLNGVKQY